MYRQTGHCLDCGARLELQADHIAGREKFENPLDADFIENMTLRCRRCNVVRRPSHKFGGLTYLTAEAALMWILLVIRPHTFLDFVRLCRMYGMTMSDIRMAEAWAMAHWLANDRPPGYSIANEEKSLYDLYLWGDSAVTRTGAGSGVTGSAQCLYKDVRGRHVLGFLAQSEDGRVRFYEQPGSFLPFSDYALGSRPPQCLAIRYVPPERKKGTEPKILAVPPRGPRLMAHSVRRENRHFYLVNEEGSRLLESSSPFGRIVRVRGPVGQCRLEAR